VLQLPLKSNLSVAILGASNGAEPGRTYRSDAVKAVEAVLERADEGGYANLMVTSFSTTLRYLVGRNPGDRVRSIPSSFMMEPCSCYRCWKCCPAETPKVDEARRNVSIFFCGVRTWWVTKVAHLFASLVLLSNRQDEKQGSESSIILVPSPGQSPCGLRTVNDSCLLVAIGSLSPAFEAVGQPRPGILFRWGESTVGRRGM